MREPSKYLEQSWQKRSKEAQERVLKTIKEMQDNKEPVNFNTVHLKSGASKNYLYSNEIIRKEIEARRRELDAFCAARRPLVRWPAAARR